MNNTESLSKMFNGMDFDAEDLIRVVSTLGEIKKNRKKESRKTLEMMLKASLLTPLMEENS